MSFKNVVELAKKYRKKGSPGLSAVILQKIDKHANVPPRPVRNSIMHKGKIFINFPAQEILLVYQSTMA